MSEQPNYLKRKPKYKSGDFRDEDDCVDILTANEFLQLKKGKEGVVVVGNECSAQFLTKVSDELCSCVFSLPSSCPYKEHI